MAKQKRIDPLAPMYLLEDEPVESMDLDGLELGSFADIISSAAVGTRGPFTIGVFGSWGTGKTSLLRLAKARVDGSKFKNIVSVWFNAWQFEHDQHPIVPLVASIIEQLQTRQQEDKSLTDQVSQGVKTTWAKLTNALRAVIYGIEAKAKVGVPLIADMEIGIATKEMISRYDELNKVSDPLVEKTLYYNAFEALRRAAPAVSAGTKDEDFAKIVVFIDDLDRCLPEKAVRLLESIKLVLTQKGFIFVIALDRPVVERYINVVLSKALDDAVLPQRGAKYLDKIFQLPIILPSHSPRFTEYVRTTMARDVFSKGAENKSLAEAISPLVETIGSAIDFNPRSFVRLVNTLIVDLRLFARSKDGSVEQRVRLFVVTRLLQNWLQKEELDFLMGSDGSELRTSLLEGREKANAFPKSSQVKENTPTSRAERIVNDMRKRFDEASNLFSLLFTDPGQTWLKDDVGRNAVVNFIRVERGVRETNYTPAVGGFHWSGSQRSSWLSGVVDRLVSVSVRRTTPLLSAASTGLAASGRVGLAALSIDWSAAE